MRKYLPKMPIRLAIVRAVAPADPGRLPGYLSRSDFGGLPTIRQPGLMNATPLLTGARSSRTVAVTLLGVRNPAHMLRLFGHLSEHGLDMLMSEIAHAEKLIKASRTRNRECGPCSMNNRTNIARS